MAQTPLRMRALVMAAAIGCTFPGLAQDNKAVADKAASEKKTASTIIEPEAIAALEKMGNYLRTLKTFEVASSTRTDVIEDDFKLQFDGSATLKVRRPDRMRIDTTSDRKQRQLFYDGKSATLYAPRLKYYATAAAPPTVRETIEVLAKKYGIDTPLADLFYWGTDQAPLADIKAASYIGPATVDGTPTDQYVFRQEGVDWQIWIQQGNSPLPRKLVITTTSEPAQPEHSANLRWNLQPKLDEADFVFKPPKGAMKIALQTVDGKVEKGFVKLALEDFLRPPSGPDRLADAAGRTLVAGPVAEEFLTGRDDPGGVAAQFDHVDELHLGCGGAQVFADPIGVFGNQGGQHRLTGVHALLDERYEFSDVV